MVGMTWDYEEWWGCVGMIENSVQLMTWDDEGIVDVGCRMMWVYSGIT